MSISASQFTFHMRPTIQSLHEKVSVLRDLEGSDGCSQDLDAKTLQDTHLVELNTDIERRLTAERQENTVRPLLLQHMRDIVRRNGQEVDLVRELMRGLNCRDIWVDEYGLDV